MKALHFPVIDVNKEFCQYEYIYIVLSTGSCTEKMRHRHRHITRQTQNIFLRWYWVWEIYSKSIEEKIFSIQFKWVFIGQCDDMNKNPPSREPVSRQWAAMLYSSDEIMQHSLVTNHTRKECTSKSFFI